MGEVRAEEAAAASGAATTTGYPGDVPVSPQVPRRRPVRNRRVVVGDQRGAERHLRVTWHRETNTFVVSSWADQVCTGSVRVPVDQAPELIGLLADGLGEAVSYVAPPEPDHRARRRSRRVVDAVLGRFGPERVARAAKSRRRAAATGAEQARVVTMR